MSPQCDRLLGLLRARGAEGATSRCAARVADLRADGFDVRTEWQAVPTRFGKTARVARYRLVERTAPYRGWQPRLLDHERPDAPERADAVGLPPSPVPTAVSPLRAARPATGERAG